MIKTLILSTGHAESTSYPVMLCTHEKVFKTLKEALQAFGGPLKRNFEGNREPKPCCKKQLKKQQPESYCPRCGNRLSALSTEMSGEEVVDAVDNMWGACYAVDSAFHRELQDDGWVFWVEGNPFKKPKEVVVVGQNAGEWVAWALGCKGVNYISEEDVNYLDGSPVDVGDLEDDE